MADSTWSPGTSTGSLGSTPSTNRHCTHREMYVRNGRDKSAVTMSPQQASPAVDSVLDSPTTSCSPRERDGHNPVEMAHVTLRPEIKPDLPPSVPNSARESLHGHSPFHHHGFANHRSVNEQLDKYMVIKQRSFHGCSRSKQDMRQLPQTDPREDIETNPDWLHRSKTDIYIERRRANLASQRACRRGGSGGYNLDGITLGTLVNQLQASGKRDHSGHSRLALRNSKLSSPLDVSGSQTRFPPLTLNRMKQTVRKDMRSYSAEKNAEYYRPCTTHVLSNFAPVFSVPDAPPNSPPPPVREHTAPKRGRLRKQPMCSIPLRIWEPSLDYVLRSSAKELQPRQTLQGFAHQTAVRQQPSPLK